MAEPVVWIIERDHWVRATLRAELIERGFDAVGFESPHDAVAALAIPAEGHPVVVVVDLASQQTEPSALAAFLRAGSRLVGCGSSVKLSGAEAGDITWSAMLRRPVSLGTIADVVASQVDAAVRPPSPGPPRSPLTASGRAREPGRG